MNQTCTFDSMFALLTGHPPFPWQQALYQRFANSDFPQSCNLSTGLGKTSVIAIWLIALANGAKVPRRLVYVVNRRTVVDQTTEEVEKYHRAKVLGIPDFAISTLRGQHADNREWSEDPSRPAVICGTVDMIGSRLLFSGYGIGMKARPLHAGFLGQDVLLVHDEAHLEPAFQELIKSIEAEQKRCQEFGDFRVVELTATSRTDGEVFELSDEDRKHPIVKQRLNSKKQLRLHANVDPKKLAEELTALALKHKESDRPILVFTRTVENVLKIQELLEKQKQTVVTLTGTMRGKERDELVEDKTFARFLPKPSDDTTPGTVYLVCTSAGEVGVNISAHHLVCDLSTFESAAQRFGRVNRFGNETDTVIDLIHPTEFDTDDEYEQRLERTLALLKKLNGDASPTALSTLIKDAIKEGLEGSPSMDQTEALRKYILAAFAPTPTILPATDILFDAWALTSIKDKLPGRPPVEPYLHGITGWEPPETYFAWREEVEKIPATMYEEYPPEKLLELYPLRPQELLREPSYRALKHLEQLAKRHEKTIAWLVDDDGSVTPKTLAELANKDDKEQINGKTIVLPPCVGGLRSGLLAGDEAAHATDVSEADDRVRVEWDLDDLTSEQETRLQNLRRCLSIEFRSSEDEDAAPSKVWHWFVARNEGDTSGKQPVLWKHHVADVEREATKILEYLKLDTGITKAIQLAAKYHDHGKRRKLFQRVLGNFHYKGDGTDTPENTLAKSGKKTNTKLEEKYRHEFGSLLDLQKEMSQIPIEQQDLVLHLIAAHHGRARPHFPLDEVFDPSFPQRIADAMATSVPQRYARLQRKYGRWGLAYLESILRAADWAASAKPSEFMKEES